MNTEQNNVEAIAPALPAEFAARLAAQLEQYSCAATPASTMRITNQRTHGDIRVDASTRERANGGLSFFG